MPWVIWITGLPGSGKSTLSLALTRVFPHAVILNMDRFRKIMTPEPTYSDTERQYVYRAIICTAQILYEQGHHVIIDATGNRRQWRELARKVIKNFSEVYLSCPLHLCREREASRIDTHGAPGDIYKKASSGSPVPGISAPYEEPFNPELVIDTSHVSQEKALEMVVSLIKNGHKDIE
jgi:adenylylsulfate kinase